MKRAISLFIAFIMLFSCFAGELEGYAAKMYAEDKIAQIQKTSGFVPNKTAYITGNCYAFISAVCERLYGKKYQEELYNGYQCKHKTGLFKEVAVLKTSNKASADDINRIINFFIQNAMPGDVVHYASLSNSGSTHTAMVQSVDNTKVRLFHSNYGSDACRIDTIYWDSLRKSPTSNEYRNGSVYSYNTILTSKMVNSSQGLGITINRYNKYSDLFYTAGAASTVPPTLTVTRSTPTSVKLSWNNVAGAVKYDVEYKLTSASSYTVATNTTTATTFEIKNLTIGNKYSFRVRAYAAGKWMNYSAVVNKTVLPPTVSTATIKPVDKGLSVSWAKKSGLSGIKIYRCTTGKDEDFKLHATVDRDASSFTDTSKIKYGTTYYYKIERYVNARGEVFSTTSKAFSKKYELATPSMICDNLSTSSVNVEIRGDGCQTKFIYYIERNGKSYLSQKTTDKTSLEIDSLDLGETYTLYCAEKTSIGQGAYGKVTFTVIPKEVTNIKAAPDYEGIKVSFDTQKDVDGFKVYRSTEPNGTFAEAATLPKGSSYYIDRNVKLKQAYYYKVKSFKHKSGVTYYSNSYETSASVTYLLPASAKLKAYRATPTAVTLKWKKVPFASTYTVQYKIKGGSWVTVADITKNTCKIKKLEIGKYYYFRVRAVNSVGKGDYTAKVKLKVLPPTPEAPTLKVVKKGIKVTIKPESYASGYYIYRCKKKNGTYGIVGVINGNSTKTFTDKNVQKGKTYYYKLVCFKKKGGVIYQSSFSKRVKQKYKK